MRITPQEEKEQFIVELLESVLISGKINKRSRGVYIDSAIWKWYG